MIANWYEHLAAWLKSKGRHRMICRERDGNQENYLERFYIFSTKYIGVYLHRFWTDDDDGLHDHPWPSISILLSGGYLEEMPERQAVPYGPTVKRLRRPRHPFIYLRSKYDAHRITLIKDPTNEVEYRCLERPTWSLFIRFGAKRRTWGFYRNGGWQAAEAQSRKTMNSTP